MKRTVFFVSDGTGITAEMLGQSLLTQFEGVDFETRVLPFVSSVAEAEQARDQINAVQQEHRPLVFGTLMDRQLWEVVASAQAFCMDIAYHFLTPLEQELGRPSLHAVGRAHKSNDTGYHDRMEAVNFTLTHDDGASDRELARADVILVGVSRCGKTPTSLYLALQFGVRVANYPLIPEDFERKRLPPSVQAHISKVLGLSIDPLRLSQIRQERRPDSVYASLDNCRDEVESAKKLLQQAKLPLIDTTTKSVEEIAARVLQLTGLHKRVF